MELYIVRHAWAGHFGDPEWPDDDQRPLTDDGKERFARLVGIVAPRGFDPQVIASSPLVRCRQTADLVAQGVPSKPDVVELHALAPSGNFDALLQWTASQARRHQRIAWVGHAPGVGRMVAVMIGSSGGWIRVAKGSIATVRFDGPPKIGAGELRWLVTAKLLGC